MMKESRRKVRAYEKYRKRQREAEMRKPEVEKGQAACRKEFPASLTRVSTGEYC
jgi:hypothetical protein